LDFVPNKLEMESFEFFPGAFDGGVFDGCPRLLRCCSV
jgi:hypothetical protein